MEMPTDQDPYRDPDHRDVTVAVLGPTRRDPDRHPQEDVMRAEEEVVEVVVAEVAVLEDETGTVANEAQVTVATAATMTEVEAEAEVVDEVAEGDDDRPHFTLLLMVMILIYTFFSATALGSKKD